MSSRGEHRTRVCLVMILSVNVMLSLVVFLGYAAVGGLTPSRVRQALKSTAPAHLLHLRRAYGADSWGPMLMAYQRKVREPASRLYTLFFTDRVKFQYPPSSLLLFDLFPRRLTITGDDASGLSLRRWLDGVSKAAVGFTALLSAVILHLGLRPRLPGGLQRPGPDAVCFALVVALGLMYYPLLVGHSIGQAQVFLNALLALGVFSYMVGWRTLAGMCVGATCLVKPHYGLVLLWALVRRQWRFALGLSGVVAVGLALSVARFGLHDHLQYLDVARSLARVGETFWHNQSFNGLLNRLLQNGNPLRPSASEFAPYHPVVHAFTVISSLAFLATALWPGRGTRRASGGSIDLLAMLVAVTIASPIVWTHHYGALLPIFAVILPLLTQEETPHPLRITVLGLSYVATANLLVWPPAIFQTPWLGLAGSHLFFGSLLLFGLLLALRRSPELSTR